MGKRKKRPPAEEDAPPVVYEVQVSDRAMRELKDLPSDEIQRIVDAIDDLAQDPRPPGATKLQGVKNGWRVRKGDYRILYTINDTEKLVLVYRVGHRRAIYKKR